MTLDRIGWFQRQAAHLRRSERNPANDRAASAGFLAGIDRMQREVREFLCRHPAEVAGVTLRIRLAANQVDFRSLWVWLRAIVS